jgi:E3 ubiquitin-protein ligase HUWE1
LLDHEGISCLLILLFIDDPKINTTRLHRILRNLCYHGPTREWVIRSLLSILEKSNEVKADHDVPAITSAADHPQSKSKKSASSISGKSDKSTSAPSWLNISLDAALGFRANVFQVTRTVPGGKKSSQTSTPSSDAKPVGMITIHPGASAVVCRHTLDVLIALAKSFPTHYLPWKESLLPAPSGASAEPLSTEASTPKPKTASAQCKKDSANDFWETLLRLDQQSCSRKGKSVARSHSSVSSFTKSDDMEEGVCATFEASPFGQLLSMLSSPVIRRSSVLTDRLLRLLSYISLGQPDSSKKAAEVAASSKDATTSNAVKANTVTPEHIQLAVQVGF